MTIDKKYKKELMRKLLHLSSLWIPLFIYFSPQILAICILSILLSANILVEYLNYKKSSFIRKYFGLIISKLSRSFELKKKQIRFSGSVFVLLASLISVILFDKNIAIVSISIMLISDTAAALVGRAFGTIKLIDGKSLEGTLAFFCSAILTCIMLNNILPFNFTVIIACLAATLFEVCNKRLHLDDNLAITLSFGLILTLF